MRVGQNPVKTINEVAKPEQITVAVLNYIPMLSGYYADLLNVLKACLNSIHETADLPFDLMVFDNGSCDEVIQYLVDENQAGQIRYLILSEKNMGKGGAWNILFGAAPGEILVYTDNDALFYPGWLSRSIQLLTTYPNVGMVTARPYHSKPEYFTQTLEWARATEGVTLEEGRFLNWEDFSSFSMSLGYSEEQSKEWYANSHEIKLTYQEVPAIVGSSHWQFCGYKSVLQSFLPFQMDRPMGQVKQLDQRMNDAGYLRLMVTDPLVQNMSNTLPRELAANIKEPKPARKKAGFARRLAQLPGIRGGLLGIYDAIFRLYYE
jgi:glycosyltransferase involved in cell wall biosynthesis